MGQTLAKNKTLVVILVIGLVLRLIKLDQSFWLDEASQAQLSSFPLSQIWSGRGGDFHPPLFYILAHFWLRFGRSEIWLRLIPVSFGVANILVIYLLAKHLFPDLKVKIGPWTLNLEHFSAFLLAISPYHIYYSQEFRSYSLLALLGTISMYLLIKKRYFWLSVINALLLYTHYSSIFLILTQIIINPVTVYYLLFTVTLWAPWLPQFFRQLQSGVNIDEYLPGWRQLLSIAPLKALPVTIFKLIAGRINFLNRYLYGLYIIFVFAVTFAGLLLAKAHTRLLLLWAFAPIFLMIVASFALPQNQPFRVIYVLPAFILLLSQAGLRFPKLTLSLLIYISLVGNITYFTRPRLQREQWRQAITFLQTQSTPIYVKFPDKFAPFFWYAPDLPVFPASRLPNDRPPKLLLLQYLSDITDPKRTIDSALRQSGYINNRTYNFEGVGFIEEYSRQP